jgi:hypothetical protein
LRKLLDPGEPGFCSFCWVFKGVFWEKRVENVVFLWIKRGEMCGKDGLRADSFRVTKILQIFQLYFSNGRLVACWLLTEAASIDEQLNGSFIS